MTLIDHFNAFQGLSKRFELSANARSLYFAVLGEFNATQYPMTLKLSNQLLQHLSGITSTHSFDTARTALINAGAIKHKKLVYSLPEHYGKFPEIAGKLQGNFAETERKFSGNSAEIFGKDSLDSTFLEVYPEEKEKDKNKEKEEKITTTTATAGAREKLSTNSEEVKQAWFLAEGENLRGYNALDLIQLENQYGTDAVVNAIHEAHRANTQPRLHYNFLKAVIERRQKGGTRNGGKARNNGSVDNSQYAGVDTFD